MYFSWVGMAWRWEWLVLASIRCSGRLVGFEDIVFFFVVGMQYLGMRRFFGGSTRERNNNFAFAQVKKNLV